MSSAAFASSESTSIVAMKNFKRERGEKKFTVLPSCALATSSDWTAAKFKTTDPLIPSHLTH